MKLAKRLLKGTRGRVLQILRRGKRTVNELAAELGVTDNAVRAHLSSLGRDGLVEQIGSRAGVRKPEALYGLSEYAGHLFPKAYGVLLNELLHVLQDRLTPQEIRDVFVEVGHRLSSTVPTGRTLEVEKRIDAAAHALSEMGGLADIHREQDRITIQGYDCPLAAAVQGHPDACILAQTFLEDVIGRPVLEHCDRTGRVPRCRFEIPLST